MTKEEIRRRLANDDKLPMKLAKILFEKEEAILPENETWDDAAEWHSHYEKCAMAVALALVDFL